MPPHFVLGGSPSVVEDASKDERAWQGTVVVARRQGRRFFWAARCESETLKMNASQPSPWPGLSLRPIIRRDALKTIFMETKAARPARVGRSLVVGADAPNGWPPRAPFQAKSDVGAVGRRAANLREPDIGQRARGTDG